MAYNSTVIDIILNRQDKTVVAWLQSDGDLGLSVVFVVKIVIYYNITLQYTAIHK